MLTIEQRRKTDRERRERWRKRKLAEGCKQVQLMITPEAQKVLKRERERTGEPFVQIINRGIINLEKGLPSKTGKTKIRQSISQKSKTRSRTSDKKKAGPQKQLNLFIGSEN
jgi:hypothetical protein